MNLDRMRERAVDTLHQVDSLVEQSPVDIATRLLQSYLAKNIYYRANALALWYRRKPRGWLLYFFPLILLAGLLRIPGKRLGYKTGVRVYSTDYGFIQPNKSIVSLMEGLPPSGVVFCAEERISQRYQDEFKRRGYHLVNVRDYALHGDISGALRSWWRFCRVARRISRVDQYISLEILYKYVVWTGFLKWCRIARYNLYNDLVPGDTVRTILMMQAGIPVVWHCHSSNYLSEYKGGSGLVEPDHVNIVADVMLVWNVRMKEYWMSQSKEIREIRIIENPWVPLIRQRREKINVGVFDEAFTEQGTGETIITGAEMIPFYRDILRLANDGRFFINLKAKIDNSHIQALRAHPEIKAFDDSIEVIINSDVVVAFPFTTPGVEAEAAGVKTIFYDPTGNMEGVYPVTHKYHELLKELLDVGESTVRHISSQTTYSHAGPSSSGQ